LSKVVYLVGSLRDKNVPIVGEKLRQGTGYEVFDQWWTASEDADDWLRDYFKFRGLSYKDAIHSYAAKHIFEFDKHHLDRADAGVLLMPAGKSCHLELGYLAGQGKKTYVLFDKEPERVDIMYNFATDVFFNIDDLITTLKGLNEDISSRPDAGLQGLQFSGVPYGGDQAARGWPYSV
jgi:hypothetical protein